MQLTTELLRSLKGILFTAKSATFDDLFEIVVVKIDRLVEGKKMLKQLLEDKNQGLVGYDRAIVRLYSKRSDIYNVPHQVLSDAFDVQLSQETPQQNQGVCEEHSQLYETLLNDQEEKNEIEPWSRYELLNEIDLCGKCDLHARVEVDINKQTFENRLKGKIDRDLVLQNQELDNIRLLFWVDFEHFLHQIDGSLLEAYNTIAKWNRPSIHICFRNAPNSGTSYHRFISPVDIELKDSVETLVRARSRDESSFTTIFTARKETVDEEPEKLRYLPPEHFLSPEIISLTRARKTLPTWFAKFSPVFLHSLLSTISTCDPIESNKTFKYAIRREFELVLNCKFSTSHINITSDDNELSVPINNELLHDVVNFYVDTLQDKYTEINRELIQRAITYATNFSYGSFFSKLNRIRKFYIFEFKHLLSDRFEENSRNLRTYLAEMIDLRQRLSTLVDTLSKDLSELSITFLVTSAFTISARLLNISDPAIFTPYGLIASSVFIYTYIPIFHLRITNLKLLGKNAVDDFQKDMMFTEQIWDFPLHTIGISSQDVDSQNLLRGLYSQFSNNQWITAILGAVLHCLVIYLLPIINLTWLILPKVIIDTVMLFLAIWKNSRLKDSHIYYFLVWILSLATAVIWGLFP